MVIGYFPRVYVEGQLANGTLHWQSDADALITKGLLAPLFKGMDGRTTTEAPAIDPALLQATGLQANFTPSRGNRFLSIFHMMLAQSQQLQLHQKGPVPEISAYYSGSWTSAVTGAAGKGASPVQEAVLWCHEKATEPVAMPLLLPRPLQALRVVLAILLAHPDIHKYPSKIHAIELQSKA